MFGIPKLILLVGLLVAVWYGFKLVGRVRELREAEVRRRTQEAASGGRMAPGAMSEIEDTVKCRVCAAYVPARGARACGRSDCPYR